MNNMPPIIQWLCLLFLAFAVGYALYNFIMFHKGHNTMNESKQIIAALIFGASLIISSMIISSGLKSLATGYVSVGENISRGLMNQEVETITKNQ